MRSWSRDIGRASANAVFLVAILLSCTEAPPRLDGWGCASDSDCVDGFLCDVASEVCVAVGPQTMCADQDQDTCDDCAFGAADPLNDGPDLDGDGLCDRGDDDDDDDQVLDSQDPAPRDSNLCGDMDFDRCDDCALAGRQDMDNDGTDTDGDGLCDVGDTCADHDGDGVGRADGERSGCLAGPLIDKDDGDATVCADADGDSCEDCVGFSWSPSEDGPDNDRDAVCDAGDEDDDNDGVEDILDVEPENAYRCLDDDADGCDDCALTGGPPTSSRDGTDTDGDGACDEGDEDDDNDGVVDVHDRDGTNRFACQDLDLDGCDDCSVKGASDPANDGADLDGDGACDAGDEDDDNDTVPDLADLDPRDNHLCQDADSDTCDDCALTGGGPDASRDGADLDKDGVCDQGDDDDDGDDTPDGADIAPRNRFLCGDQDGDTCDDCRVTGGPANTAQDGLDTDGDGRCNAGDQDDDNDGTLDEHDPDPLDPHFCGDTDLDTCDDCSQTGSPPDASNDGTDTDGDGRCNAGDPDDDGDEVLDLQDPNPLNRFLCGDEDHDNCDDCSQTGGPPNQAMDGPDDDGDGICDTGDGDDDNDTVPNGLDIDPNNAYLCRDADGDTCDDCSVSGVPDEGNDGDDFDGDGLCDDGDEDDDNDTVVDGEDTNARNRNVCRDVDGDSCDDCSVNGVPDEGDDGDDFDDDGVCDDGDEDDDNDTVPDLQDDDPFNAHICSDDDTDTCDDCSVSGFPDQGDDGSDFDGDGQCDAGDPDDDNDTVLDGEDIDDFNEAICGDSLNDGCDDCAVTKGPPNENNDGSDFDLDGWCDAGDTDDDNDSVLDGQDSDPFNKDVCTDVDGDGCDDCAVTGGPPNAANDGADSNGDGLCDEYPWFHAGWSHRKELTIDGSRVTGTLTDFPVLVSISNDADLVAGAPEQDPGFIFTAGDGRQQLDHEVALWIHSSGDLQAWVRMPELSHGADTSFYIYYGNASAGETSNPAGVWSAGYAGVWHLEQTPPTAMKDSSPEANHCPGYVTPMGIPVLAASDLTVGRVGNAIRFDDYNNSLDCGSPLSLNITPTITLELWLRAEGFENGDLAQDFLFAKRDAIEDTEESCSDQKDNDNDTDTDCSDSGCADTLACGGSGASSPEPISAYALSTVTAPGSGGAQAALRLVGGDITDGLTSPTVLGLGTWYYVAAVLDGTTGTIYVQGSAEAGPASMAGAAALPSMPLAVGARWATQRPSEFPQQYSRFYGVLDELRISNVARSSAWISTSYANQGFPGTFMSVGEQEIRP